MLATFREVRLSSSGFFLFCTFLSKIYTKKISSISMLVMSLVFTIGAWLVNFTHFAYLQFLHIITFAFLSKIFVRLITFAIYALVSTCVETVLACDWLLVSSF